MSFTAYRLYFEGPLHISDSRSDYGSSESKIHSDSFYAALIAALAKIQEEVNADLGCTISSLFPFTTSQKDKIIYFFPKPFIDLKNYAAGYSDIKKLKRVEWLDKNYFEELLNGAIRSNINDYTINGAFLSSEDFEEKFIEKQVLPRVAVPRSAEEYDGNTNIFYIEKTYFKEDSGLFFLSKGDTTQLEKALHILQHEGIGTDRNVGFGSFRYEIEPNLELQVPNKADHYVSLSLFNPGDKETLNQLINDPNTAWEITKRGGWITSEGNTGIRKKSIYMMNEGSIFYSPYNNMEVLGKVDFDLKPEAVEGFTPPNHPIWRSGRSLFLPIKMKKS
ncbi:MAG: type III-A CRISPR-associated RAMP protein Csm4 [Bacteroidetes bacterium]|nr:type III-A CRISPR-associated RAMP protein Csm4 [Bacteroidota bacterium]